MAKEVECHFGGCHATILAEMEGEVLTPAENHADHSHPDLELDANAVESIGPGIVDHEDRRLCTS